jgi:hypothetical protein
MIDMPRGNDENKWATFQDGTGKAAFPAFAEAATRRQVAIWSCSRTGSTFRASKWLRPCWTTFLTIPVSIGIEIF